MSKSFVSGFVFMLLSAAFLSACGQAEPTPVVLTVDMKEFTFEPAQLSVPAGADVTVNLSNSGTLEHEMVIFELNEAPTVPFSEDDEEKIYWEAELEPGQSGTYTFVAPETPGVYQLICGIPGHLEANMVGNMTVTQP